jgi:hypothetical protein
MASAREQLQEVLDTLKEGQIETVLHFAEAIRKGRVVVSACDLPDSGAVLTQQGEPDAR